MDVIKKRSNRLREAKSNDTQKSLNDNASVEQKPMIRLRTKKPSESIENSRN